MRAVTAGARDKTIRFWKVVDESQLVFRGGGRSRVREILEGGVGAGEDEEDEDEEGGSRKERKKGKGKGKEKSGKYVEGSLECVAMVDESHFLSGGDSGSICLWNTNKKKPIFTYPLAHGLATHVSETEGDIHTPRWITSIACLPYSDFFASGSWDGQIRLWRLDPKLKSFSSFPQSIPAPGIVNSLQLVTPPTNGSIDLASWRSPSSSSPVVNGDGKKKAQQQQEEALLVAAVGQEPRLGRWMRLKGSEGKNAIVLAHFVTGQPVEEKEDGEEGMEMEMES